MKVISDTLTVTFDSSPYDEASICVSRVINGKFFVLKMELGEQADILYHLLTEQMTKAEIKEVRKVMEIKEAIERYTSNAEYERSHGNLQGCLEFKQLAEWLNDYKRLLEQEPCSDAISRQAILDCKYAISDDEIGERKYVVDVTDIVELPSVIPTRPTGHWIQTNEFFINQDGQFIYQFICSECKSLSYFRKRNKKAIGANVCPNCGADMREGEA